MSYFLSRKSNYILLFRGIFVDFQKAERVLQNFYILLELIQQGGNGFLNTLIGNR